MSEKIPKIYKGMKYPRFAYENDKEISKQLDEIREEEEHKEK